MRQSFFRLSIVGLIAMTAVPVNAHPGHGEAGPQHYWTEPMHAVTYWGTLILALSVVAVRVAQAHRKSSIDR